MTVARKPDNKMKQPKLDYPPWMKKTECEHTTTVTAEGRQVPQPSDETYQTSITVKKKPEAPKKPVPTKKPQVAMPPWMKDTEVDKKTTVTAEKKVWKSAPKKFETTVKTTVGDEHKPQDYPPWVRETEIDKTTTVTAYGSPGQPIDQTYQTTVTVPGKGSPLEEKEKKVTVTTENTIPPYPGPSQKGMVLAEKKITKPIPAPKPTKSSEPVTKTLPADQPTGIGVHETDITTRTIHEKFPTVPSKLVIPVEDLKLTIPVRTQSIVQSPYPHDDFIMLEAVFASPWKPSTDTVSEAVIRLEQSRLDFVTGFSLALFRTVNQIVSGSLLGFIPVCVWYVTCKVLKF